MCSFIRFQLSSSRWKSKVVVLSRPFISKFQCILEDKFHNDFRDWYHRNITPRQEEEALSWKEETLTLRNGMQAQDAQMPPLEEVKHP